MEVEGEGPAMVLIESRSPGVEIAESFNSVDGSHHAHFTFCDVRVPSGHIIGKAGTGLKRASGNFENAYRNLHQRVFPLNRKSLSSLGCPRFYDLSDSI